MQRIRFRTSAAVLLAAAGISAAVLLGVHRLEAANNDLSQADLDVIVAQAVASASLTNSGFRTSPTVQKTKEDLSPILYELLSDSRINYEQSIFSSRKSEKKTSS